MRKIIFLFMVCQSLNALAQFREDFSDGRFLGENRAVVWSGDVADFQVNTALQLQLNSSVTTGSNFKSQLRTPNARLQHTTWSFDVKMGAKPTSGNYVNVFLASDEPDLIGSLNGFYIRIGHTKNNLCLIRSVKSGAEQFLIQGTENRLDKSSFKLSVKAILDDDGVFKLYSRLDDETGFTEEGSCTVSLTTLPEAHWFGLVCTFSGGNSKKYYFDNIIVKNSDESDPEPEVPSEENLPVANDLVINEILYDKPTGGEEYVELYNRSTKSIDLRYVGITTRK
ncbi:MAG: lamin tail domain-containing protein, partial [Dysgonamonadaceae bacterium]|nr:lamin tail domain-containing protein [Dysgonamonadaceae bacterium]